MDYFDRLGKAGIGFVSILNQVDYSRPEGKFMLVMLGGLAELYSDNLSEETKKGWSERKAQGLYCGPLPFGATKDENGVPVPHPQTYEGLRLMFKASSEGKSDRDVAKMLNSASFRTSGTHGSRPFSKDTVRGILTNKFYAGKLPDGNGDWVEGRHQPFIPHDLFEQVQQMREINRSKSHTIRRTANTYSLSGLLKCVDCKGPMWVHQNHRGRARIYCRERARSSGCTNRGTFLDVYEGQVQKYLRRFVIPKDYQERMLELYRSLNQVQSDVKKRQSELTGRLERIKKLFEWGDKSEADYIAERRQITEELAQLTPDEQQPDVLDRLRSFLADLTAAWEDASQEQRNRVARQLFEVIWVKDATVIAVRPQTELRGFFQISEECQVESMSGDPDRIRTDDLWLDRPVC